MACVKCGVWFHYSLDETGKPLPGDGTWILGLTAPCAGVLLQDMAFPGQPASGQNAPLINCAFQSPLNSGIDVTVTLALQLGPKLYDEAIGKTPVQLSVVAKAFYDSGQTILNAAQGPADDYSQQQCADPPPVGQPGECPPGQVYSVEQEGCVPLVPILPLPIPPLNPQPPPPQPPPPQPPPPQPPPGDDGDLDEIGRCCVQVNANLGLIQEEIQQLKFAITGTGQQLDPVTCGQLTALFRTLDLALLSISRAISAAASAGGTPVDLTTITTALDAIDTDLKALANKADSIGTIPPSSTTTVDNRFGALLSQTMQEWVKDGTIEAADAQPLI